MGIDYNSSSAGSVPGRGSIAASDRPRRRRARRSPNRPKILAAARARFAAQGFQGATVAQIAADVGVDQALVVRLFGSKAALFEACIQTPDELVDSFKNAMSGPAESLGERIALAWLRGWENPVSGPPLRATYLSAATSPAAAERLHRLMEGGLLEQLIPPERLTDRARAQAAAIGVQLLGAAVGRYVFELDSLARMPIEDYAAMIAPGIQAQTEALLDKINERTQT